MKTTDFILSAIMYIVVVIVCGIAADWVLGGIKIEWGPVMIAQIKVFALTAILVLLTSFLYSSTTGSKM